MIRQATVADLPMILRLEPERGVELTPTPATLNSWLIPADDCLIAYGKIELFAELVLTTNKNISPFTRATAIKDLMRKAVEACKDKPISEFHAFTADPRFAEFLANHLGFVETKEKALVYTLR